MARPTSLFLFRERVAELDDSEIILKIFRGDLDLQFAAFVDHLARYLAAHIGNLAFELPDAGLAGVVLNHGLDRVVRNAQIRVP